MEDGATFKKKTVQSILQMNFKDEKTKVNPDAVFLFTEVLRIFVAEGASRAANQAKTDGSNEVCIDHFEKILPQLVGCSSISSMSICSLGYFPFQPVIHNWYIKGHVVGYVIMAETN